MLFRDNMTNITVSSSTLRIVLNEAAAGRSRDLVIRVELPGEFTSTSILPDVLVLDLGARGEVDSDYRARNSVHASEFADWSTYCSMWGSLRRKEGERYQGTSLAERPPSR